MIRAIFFDLDGTLLPMDENKFSEIYFGSLAKYLEPHGYDPKQVIKGIWTSAGAMMTNNSGRYNEEVFWETFNAFNGRECRQDEKIFNEYYKTTFPITKNACGENPYARKIVEFCRENFEFVLLTTNPLFPRIATETRMGYVDLRVEDFDFVTTFENFMYCKPNPKFFIEIMNRFNLKPEEILVIGNHTGEDCACAKACGIQSILLKVNIIYDPNVKEKFEEVEPSELIDYLKKIKNS